MKGTGDTKFFAPASRDVATAPKETSRGNDAPPARERGSYDADSAFKLYLREIGQVKLLTIQEEIDLAALIKKGELRTNVSINGSPFDYVNHYIFTRNETPERVRLTVPKALLRKGKNVFRFEQVGIAVEFDPALKSGAK